MNRTPLSWLKLFISYFDLLLWIFISIVSINHITIKSELLTFSCPILGCIFLIALLSIIIRFAIPHIRPVLIIFGVFFCANLISGPYLEPPGDPFDHIKYSYEYFEKVSNEIPKTNRGLWVYGMSGLLLRTLASSSDGDWRLAGIRIIHGFYCGLLAVCIFLISTYAGLPNKWAFIGCLIAFCFFGTNRFSYFSYYSFSPSFFAMMMYWLWVIAFFFHLKDSWKHFTFALLISILMLPILVVNHVQETFFLGLTVIIYSFIFIYGKFYLYNDTRKRYVCLFVLFGVFFVAPQFHFVRDFLSQFFVINDWEKNQSHVLYLNNIHIMGKIWKYRVNDTLGLLGLLPAAILLVFLCFGRYFSSSKNQTKILILGILPLIVYCTPLLNFIWLSNCEWRPTHVRYYFRFAYCSFFWLSISYFLFKLEPVILNVYRKYKNNRYFLFKSSHRGKEYFFMSWLFIILAAAMIRQGPIYGKLDFMFLDNQPWWSEWKPMIQKLMKQEQKPIYTDALTGNVINSIFNQSIATDYQWKFRGSKLNVKSMDTLKNNQKYRCIINLHGFTPSWVPKETDHWNSKVAGTSIYYHYKGYRGDALKDLLKKNPPKYCDVYF